MKKNFIFKRVLTLVLAVMMLVTAAPVGVLADPAATGNQSDGKFELKYDNGTIVRKEDYINETKNLPVVPKKTDNAKKLVANPDMPILYTVHSDFKVQRGDDLVVAYQPYIATAGDAISKEEKDKIKTLVKFPVLDGYTSATPNGEAEIKYDFIKDKAKAHKLDGYEYKGHFDYKYTPKTSTVKVKHVFQDIKDFNKYTNPDGTITQGTTIINADGSQATLSEAEIKKHERISTQYGLTGTSLTIQPLPDFETKGYVPEDANINTQVPENPDYFVVEYRYNLAHYTVNYDTGEKGSPLPTRTLFYNQIIPKLNDLTTKDGAEFLGWKPSIELKGTLNGVEKTFNADEIIKDNEGNAIVDLHNLIYEKDANGNLVYEDLIDPATGKPKKDPVTRKNIKSTKVRTKNSSDTISLIMPAEKLTFTAVWKDKEKADYAVQFWAEKADHTDNASLLEKYDFIGTRVYKDQPVKVLVDGKWEEFRPGLDNVPVDKIVFPDLDQARLAKIWAGARFNRGKDLYLNKFYVYNKDLTHDQNKDPANVNLVKSVDSTGKTVYNIYYDRQVYELYFTKSNAQPAENTFYPEIWGYDEAQDKVVKKGGPGNPYHYKARFNQLMLGWPNDAMQTKGFTPGYQSFGWGPNYNTPNWPGYLDTPPYRLNADEFLDMPNYDRWGGYKKPIDKGDGTFINVDPLDFTTLSFGIKQAENSMPHHMDFWMDGFKDGETIIRYDLYRFKADTNSESYAPKYPKVQGFTGKRNNETPEYLNSDGIDEKNEERAEVTPFPDKTYKDMYGEEHKVGEMQFIKVFFNNSDDWGDSLDGNTFPTNGYLKFEYKRNKYPLRFNYDPSKIKGDNEFNATNQLQTFYEFPLKALSPKLVDDSTPQADREYFKENPANFLDDPENLKKLGLTDLVFTDPKDGKLKVKRPDNLSDDMVFKGWALDPAGFKLISENASEKMPNHAVNIYAKWGDPDTRLGITFDANGGTLPNIDPAKLTQKQRTIKEGDVDNETDVTYPIKVRSDSKKAVFTVIQKQKLVEPARPTRDGYNFLGWEVIRYKKDATTGEYTNDFDTSFKDEYGVPELYSFGNEVAGPLYLKAIWVKNDLVDVKSYHHFLDENYKETDQDVQTLRGRRVGLYLAAVGSRQNAKRFLVPKTEWGKLEKGTTDIQGSMLYKDYKTLDPDNPRVNSYNQQIRVEPEKIQDPDDPNKLIANPDAKLNQFHFYYRPFRHREYKVNYLDERGRKDVEAFIKQSKIDFASIKEDTTLTPEGKSKAYTDLLASKRKAFKDITDKYAIIKQETIKNGKRHYDARNYRPIDGWVLDDKPQKQLFFDIDEDSSAFFGINETGLDEIYFFYKDVRVIETKKDDPVPDGYVRVTYKADKGGAFTDRDGNSKTELYYDVIIGLKSDNLPVPQEWVGGKNEDGSEKQKEEGKYYITPDDGRKFIKWDKAPLLNKDTIINEAHEFTAYFDWSGAAANPMVITEAFKDPKNTWTNDFAPTIEKLKKQIVWKAKDETSGKIVDKPLPEGTTVEIVKDDGTALTDDDVFKLVNEKKAADKDELVRTVNVKAKVTFKDGKDPQELTIPITVYKNVYEALTGTEKPLFLTEAEAKEAKEGGLQDVTGEYVKVTVAPTGDMNSKDNKVYYVNKNAWVVIPEAKPDGSSTFINWTADIIKQNDDGKANGNFDFTKRHKFTEETVIKPVGVGDVVEQTDPSKKPDVPKAYVEVIVKTSDKATDETAFEKTFWVNPTKEVTIPVSKPNGKTIASSATNPQQIAWIFDNWTSDKNIGPWTDTIKAQFTADVTTINANYTKAKNIIPYNPEDPITRPDKTYVRVKFAAEEGLTLSNIQYYYVKKNSGVKLSDLNHPNYEESTGYKFDKWDKADTTEIGDQDLTVKALANKLGNVIPEKDASGKPNDKPTGYKEVIFVIKTGDESKGSIDGVAKFYVKPNEYVKIDPPATKANTGFEFGSWNKNTTIPTAYTDEVTTITGSFNELKAVIPNTNPDGSANKQPAGYKTVTFVIDPETGGEIEDGEVTVYYVNPDKDVTVPQPKTQAETGYEFEKWDQDTVTTAKMYTDNTIVKGNFKKLEDIIPSTDNQGKANARPDGYVTVTFDKGEHGTLKGQKVYYVNPNANKTIGDIEIVKPKVTAETGWKQKAAPNAWDKEDTTLIKGPDVILVKAQYDPIDDVVPKDNPQGGENKIPAGYITVTFEKGEHGELEGNTVFYINPNKAVVLEGKAPTIKPNTGYTSAGWDTTINKAIQYKDGDKITALYNEKDDVIPQIRPDGTDQPAGYHKVIFEKGEHGELSGQTVYYVNPNKEVTVPAPTVTAKTGYKFDKWDKELTQTFTAEITTITAKYEALDNIIPQKNTDGSDKPDGYITVTFKADANGSLAGNTVYYVNSEKIVDLTDTAKNITKNPNTGYTEKGGKWSPAIESKVYIENAEYEFNFEELSPVIKKTRDDESEKPDGYVRVKFIPTNNATDETKAEKVYFVNPLKEVTITNKPEGKEMDINGNKSSFKFIGWTVTRGSIASWPDETINGKFIQETEITAKYEFKWINIIQEPIPKDNAVTAKGDLPKPENLIKNIPGSPEKPLPEGTNITYEEAPNVDNTGNVTAKVKVEYPSGATTIVDVPLTVVDNVVPQIGNDKPLVPESYIKVTVDTTDNATENTKYVKIFWVKPNVDVTLDGIYEPIGKDIVDGNVTKPNKFLKWTLLGSNPPEEYTVVNNTITASFEKDSTIIANYKNVENIKPVGKDNLWFPLNKETEPKDFIENVYDDDDPNNKNNLPPGTILAFKEGTEHSTGAPGPFTATIEVTYPNGEVKTIYVPYNVTADVVEQEPGSEKPIVPEYFVRVVVSSEELPDRATFEPNTEPVGAVEKADSKFTRTFWVDSRKPVTIPVEGRKIVGIKDNVDHRQWIFDHWQGVTIEKKNYGDNEITGEFPPLTTQANETTYYVLAKYRKDDVPKPYVDYIVTDVGVYPSEEQYRTELTAPMGKTIAKVEVLEKPDVSRVGRTKAKLLITYDDGVQTIETVKVYVQERQERRYPEIIYRDRIVEKEKIVEKIVKIKDNERLKELRYMQGFNGKFRPYDGLRRSEAAQILANALKADGYAYDPFYPISYTDIGDSWYTEAVRIVSQAGVFQGYSDGTFKPEGKITRAEWVATLRRFQDLKKVSGNDMGLSMGHWATEEIEAAYQAGWLGVYQDGIAHFDADKPITRQEVAYVSNKAFDRVLDKAYLKRNVNNMIHYKDINPSMPLYEDILCASNTLLTDGRYYKANVIDMDTLTFNIITDDLLIYQKKFQYISH